MILSRQHAVTSAISGITRWCSCLLFIISAVERAASGEVFAPYKLTEVRVEGDIGRRIDMTIANNVLQIDHDEDFLKSFRNKNREAFAYVGLGKELDAVVRFAVYSQNPKVIALKKQLIAETIKTQSADGYIGIFANRPREENPELGEGGRLQVWWDIHEMAYVIFGLVSDYRYFGNEEALAAARKAADYIIENRPPTPIVVHVSTTGLELAFIALAEATGEEKYRDYVNYENSLANWRGEVAGHTYNQLGVCLAQLEMYRRDPNARLLEQSHRTLKFITEEGGLLVSGTCSRDEGWHRNQEDTGKTAETCVTAYFIRWLDRLMQIEAKPEYGDMMERAIFNALFAAQSPDGRELRKYTAHTGKREFYEGEKSSDFKRDTYCCPNNYRRIVAELPGFIYYADKDGVVVNLYTASRLETRVRETPVQIVQETEYPSRGQVLIRVEPEAATKFALKLRVPSWATGATVSINGEPAAESPAAGQFFAIDRTWKPGDRVALELPLQPRWQEGGGVHEGEVALLYGPLLFCVNPAVQSEEVQELISSAAAVEGKEKSPLMVRLDSIVAHEAKSSLRPLALELRGKLPVRGEKEAEIRFTEFTDPGGRQTFVRPAPAAVK